MKRTNCSFIFLLRQPRTICITYLFSIFLTACITSELTEFNKIRLGMDKGQVVETLGPPVYKDRRESKDRWYYTFYENNTKYEKLLVFEEGKLIYAGRVTTPAYMSNANSVDKKNAELNSNAEKLQYTLPQEGK